MFGDGAGVAAAASTPTLEQKPPKKRSRLEISDIGKQLQVEQNRDTDDFIEDIEKILKMRITELEQVIDAQQSKIDQNTQTIIQLEKEKAGLDTAVDAVKRVLFDDIAGILAYKKENVMPQVIKTYLISNKYFWQSFKQNITQIRLENIYGTFVQLLSDKKKNSEMVTILKYYKEKFDEVFKYIYDQFIVAEQVMNTLTKQTEEEAKSDFTKALETDEVMVSKIIGWYKKYDGVFNKYKGEHLGSGILALAAVIKLLQTTFTEEQKDMIQEKIQDIETVYIYEEA
jgi:hypothetical protein